MVTHSPLSLVRLLLQHLQVTYPYQPIITFGGFRDDFMVVVSQTKDQAQAKKTVDKFIFAMSKPKVRPLKPQPFLCLNLSNLVFVFFMEVSFS